MNVHTHPLYDAQLEIEADMLDAGRAAFRSAIAKDMKREQGAAIGGGSNLIRNVVPEFAQAITDWVVDMRDNNRGRRARAYPHIKDVEPELLAFITCRIVLDRVLARGGATLTRSALEVGKWVETELRLRAFEKDKRKLIDKSLKELDKRSGNRDFRRSVIMNLMGKMGDDWQTWPEGLRLQVGLLLIEKMAATWGIIEMVQMVDHRNRNAEYRIVPTQRALDWIAEANERLELLRPIVKPCVIPPMPWVTPEDGGFWSEELREINPIIRSYHIKDRMALLKEADLTNVYRAINTVQSTAWKINTPVLNVMREVWDSGINLDVLPNRDVLPLPPKPADIDTNKEALTAWKKAAAEVYTLNAQSVSRRLNVERTLMVAEEYKDREAMYYVYQCDFRGRMYAAGAGPNPQGADYQKALITFAEGKRIGDDTGPGWLAIHGANSFGVDKVSLEERIEWTQQHSEQIVQCADDPLTHTFWATADQPWVFLAFCYEWAGFIREGAEFVTTLPIMVDGTCNGLQHYSAMLRDEVGGAATNLVPSPKPQDIYGRVAEVVLSKDPSLKGIVDRSITKRPVMVLPYGGTFNSCKDYVRDALRSKGHKFEEEEVRRIAALIWESIGDVVVAARAGMGYLRKLASAMNKKGKHMQWTTPSGWVVFQQYFNMDLWRVECTVMGERVRLGSAVPDLNSLDARRSGQGLAPNFVHSMDASALIGMVNLCLEQDQPIHSFAVVHDSFGTLAPDMDMLSACVRHAFVQMYEDHDVMQELRDVVAGAIGARMAKNLEEVPALGSLDLEGIKRSDFFFA